MQNDPSFEISLTDFLAILLREDHCTEISPKLASIVEVLSANKCICHVQWTSFTGERLSSPLLWRYKYWIDSSEKWLESKRRSEEARVKKYIFDANIRRLSRAYVAQFNMDETKATDLSITILSRNLVGGVRLVGVKLITKESEL